MQAEMCRVGKLQYRTATKGSRIEDLRCHRYAAAVSIHVRICWTNVRAALEAAQRRVDVGGALGPPLLVGVVTPRSEWARAGAGCPVGSGAHPGTRGDEAHGAQDAFGVRPLQHRERGRPARSRGLSRTQTQRSH
jgi:hypothetical protein